MVQFYCTGAKQQEENGKKNKKGEKKASLGMGQSVLWRLLTHLGALFLLTVWFLFPWGISGPPSVGQPHHPAQLVLNNCFPFLTTTNYIYIYAYIYKVEGVWISIFFVGIYDTV